MIFFITNLKLNHIYLNDNHMKIKTFQSHKNNDNLLNLAFVTTISAHRLAAFKSLEPTLHIQPTIRSPPETQTFPTVLTTVSAVAVQEIAKIVPTSSSNILHYSSAEALSVIPLGRTASRGMSWWWPRDDQLAQTRRALLLWLGQRLAMPQRAPTNVLLVDLLHPWRWCGVWCNHFSLGLFTPLTNLAVFDVLLRQLTKCVDGKNWFMSVNKSNLTE